MMDCRSKAKTPTASVRCFQIQMVFYLNAAAAGNRSVSRVTILSLHGVIDGLLHRLPVRHHGALMLLDSQMLFALPGQHISDIHLAVGRMCDAAGLHLHALCHTSWFWPLPRVCPPASRTAPMAAPTQGSAPFAGGFRLCHFAHWTCSFADSRKTFGPAV